MRKKDAVLVAFFCGTITIIVFMIVTLLSIPDKALYKEDSSSGTELLSSLHTFRFLFMLIFVLAATGYIVKYLRLYHINYIYIFDLDPQYKITHSQLFKMATILFSAWAFFLLC